MPFSEWLIGFDPAADADMVAHVAEPWFCAKFCDADLAELTDDADPDGTGHYAGDSFFYSFRWQGVPPSEEEIQSLCEEAVAAICYIEDITADDIQRKADEN